ncbi:hypothetical protein [Streptomyces rugosispiralis]|uniref:Uncharacterized protein n=1 Tax=Streptomyces rugosispiralis TaxID=2967341 RepID=A0ABT1VB84_9ACTN|nr:hypothetical protein [Streptomyces rugosispiralis]MCQ8194660.1 hypothetical protein [Streptomyces rugosispiralis]
MTDTARTPADTEPTEREQAAAAVLPVLTSLDQQATVLEQASDKGEQIAQSNVAAYELTAHHAKHLIGAGGLSTDDIKAAATEHGGTQARKAAERALDHADHPRNYETTSTEDTRDVEEEHDLDL